MTAGYAAAYLAGIIEGEGSISVPPRSRSVRITNCDAAIIDAVCQALDALNVTWGKTWRAPHSRSNYASCEISVYGRANLARLRRCLTLHGKKNDLLTEAASYVRPAPPLDEIRRLREAGLTVREIANEVGYASKSTVEYHLNRMCGLL